jgi:hypothetical protein
MEEQMNRYMLLVGKPEEKRRLRKCRWANNIRMDLLELGFGDVYWIRIGTGGELL